MWMNVGQCSFVGKHHFTVQLTSQRHKQNIKETWLQLAGYPIRWELRRYAKKTTEENEEMRKNRHGRREEMKAGNWLINLLNPSMSMLA